MFLSLIFNCTHERQGAILLPSLIDSFKKYGVIIDFVIFCTNDTYDKRNPVLKDNLSGDLLNLNDKCEAGSELMIQRGLLRTYDELCGDNLRKPAMLVCASVEEAAKKISEHRNNSQSNDVRNGGSKCLICGSLHLVGSALTVLGAAVE